MSNEFDYGIIEYDYRFDLSRALDSYRTIRLDKCIMIGLERKARPNTGEKWFEFQIIHKDKDNKNQCLILKLKDYSIKIIKKGNMQINL